jgi:transcription antitermination factor NusG
MFSCYAFVRMVQTSEERLKALRTPGVLGFVGYDRQGTSIPDEQIESLRKGISENILGRPHPLSVPGSASAFAGIA